MDERWAQYWVNKYRWALEMRGDVDEDDLMQAARIGMWEAEKTYRPELGEWSTYSAFWIRREIRLALGVKRGQLPPPEIHLDEPITWDAEETMLDMLADDTMPDIDSGVLMDDRAQIIREAVARLEDQQQREVVEKLYFEEKPGKQVAAEMNLPKCERVFKIWDNARRRLRRDKYLRELREVTMDYHIKVGPSRFNTTHTSAVEEAVMRYYRERGAIKRRLNNEFSDT